jgi:hypothetical protein
MRPRPRALLSARGRAIQVLGRRGPRAELPARVIALAADVTPRNLVAELATLKRAGVVTSRPAGAAWVGRGGHLWMLTTFGRQVFEVLGR